MEQAEMRAFLLSTSRKYFPGAEKLMTGSIASKAHQRVFHSFRFEIVDSGARSVATELYV